MASTSTASTIPHLLGSSACMERLEALAAPSSTLRIAQPWFDTDWEELAAQAGASAAIDGVHRTTILAAPSAAAGAALAERLLLLCGAAEADRCFVVVLLALPRTDATCVARLVEGGRRAVRVYRSGALDVFEVRSPDDGAPLVGSAADTKERRAARYKVEKRLGLAEEPAPESALAMYTLFLDKSGAALAVGYARVLYGDHGAYIEFAPAHLAAVAPDALPYFDLRPEGRFAGGPYYDIARGE